MSFKDMSKEELELLSYTDITNLILEEQGEQTTPELFRQIVDRLGLSNKTFEDKIGSYYTSLTTDKRFVLLDGKWDLKVNHPTHNLITEEDLEDLDELPEDDNFNDFDDEEEEKEDYYSDDQEEEVDSVAEEYKNLVIIDEEDLNSDE